LHPGSADRHHLPVQAGSERELLPGRGAHPALLQSAHQYAAVHFHRHRGAVHDRLSSDALQESGRVEFRAPQPTETGKGGHQTRGCDHRLHTDHAHHPGQFLRGQHVAQPESARHLQLLAAHASGHAHAGSFPLRAAGQRYKTQLQQTTTTTTTTTTTNMLYTALNALRFFAYRQDDSDVDRLHYWLTSNVLIALSLLVSFKQFGGKPIECLVPKMFSSAWEQYAENFCWAQDTYFLPFDESVPKDITDRERLKISYYKWVPFFLLLEALCFRLPSIMWRYLADHSGIRIRDVINLAMDERNVRAEIKEQNIDALTKHILNALQFHRRLEQQQQQRHVASPHRLCRLLNLPYTAAYVTSVYLLIKLLYVLNVAAQLLMLNRFLNTDTYQWYGFEALADVLNGTTWENSGFFPRVTLCDFQVRVMGNVQRYSVQCVLVINLFNEKIFTLLWFWYTVLFLITAASFAYWAYAILLPWPGRWFISRHLQLTDEPFNGNDKDDVRRLRRFVNDYLKSDGVFLVRLITSRSSIVFGTELLGSLWRSFHEIDQQLRLNNAIERVEKSNWLRRHGFKGRRRNRGSTGEQKTPVNPSSQEEIQDAVRKLLPLLRERADLATSPRLTNLQGEEDDDQATAIDTDNPTNQQPSCYDG
ncbi:Innexin-10, partial [Trichinella murrelli]